MYEYNICGIVGQKLVDVCLSLLAYRSLWLKFLVLISFPCYAGFFNHPQLDTKEHDRLKHETRDRYQSWKESKVESNPNQENKMKNWGSIHPPPPTTPASSRQFITDTYLGVKPKAVPRPPPLPLLVSFCYSFTLWYKHLFSTLQYYNRIFNIHYNINTTIFFLKSFNTVILQWFETVFFHPSDLPRRTHLWQPVF